MNIPFAYRPNFLVKVFDKIIEIEKDELAFLQIIPSISIQNKRSIDSVVNAIHSINKPLFERINFKDKKIIYKIAYFATYAIYYDKKNIKFYLGCPSRYVDFIKQRIYNTFDNECTVLNAQDYLNQFNVGQTLQWDMHLEKPYFKALLADYRENTPIPSLLATIKDVKENEKACLEIILNPIEDYWKETATDNMKKYRKGKLDDNMPQTLFDKFFLGLMNLIFGVFDVIFSVSEQKEEEKRYISKLEPATNQKINYNGFEGYIRLLAQSEDEINREQILKSMSVALDDLSLDNNLKVVKKRKKIKSLERKIPKVKIHYSIYNTREIAQFFQMPEGKWQKEFPQVKNVDTKEMDLPKQLFQDGIPIGEIRYRGKKQIASWPMKDKDVSALPIALFGMQGSGKSEYEINYAVHAIEKGQSVFVLDGIKNCEMSTKIRDYSNISDEKVIDIDFSNMQYVIPLLWNEVKMQNIKSENDKMIIANYLSRQLILFLDSLVDDNSQKLSPRMKRYLNSASLLTFSLDRQTSIMDVLNCLADYETRHELIKESKLNKDNKIIKDLLALDKGNQDTNVADIKGIVDRMDLILGDYILNNLFSSNSETSLNFTHFADNGYLVLCRMPQSGGRLNDGTIDTLMTFLLSKIWLAILMRKNNNLVNVIIDEIHRTPTAKKVLEFPIRESRKYSCKFMFSAHKVNDFRDLILGLRNAGTSYMLFNTSRDNLMYFEEEIKPFTIFECLDTKKYHSKVICNFDKEYCVFDSKVILPIDITREKKDRSYIQEQCQKKYGMKN